MRKMGRVIEALPSMHFRVEMEDGKIWHCYLSGKLFKAFIKVLVGDKVEVEIPEVYGSAIGRIVTRFK